MLKTNHVESDDEYTTNEEVVIVHLDCHQIGSTLLTNFYRTIPKFKINSNVIVKDNIAISNELIFHTKHENQSIPPQLLYRASRDGFKPIDFHSRCDNQGPTLTIIKSSAPHNQIFGGFTTQSWKSTSEWISDGAAFLFKIDDNQVRKFNIQPLQKEQAMFTDTNHLPIFGAGYDIFISNECNLNDHSSYSDFGYTYELPPSSNNIEYQYANANAESYLAGSYEFKVSEIEVFKIIR